MNKHDGLADALAGEVANDTAMIGKINEIVALYQEARKATARRRAIARQMQTAIRHADEKRLKLLVPEWREASRKVGKYKF